MKNLSKTIQLGAAFMTLLIFITGLSLSGRSVEVNSSNPSVIPTSTGIGDDSEKIKDDECKKGKCNPPLYNGFTLVKKDGDFIAPEAKGKYKKDEKVSEDKIENVGCPKCDKCREKGPGYYCALFIKLPKSNENPKPEFKLKEGLGDDNPTPYVKGAEYKCECQK